MQTQHTILFCTPDPPGAIWQDKPQIAHQLARRHIVLHCGPPLYLRSLLRQLRAGHWHLADLWRPTLAPMEDNIHRFAWSPWAPITGAPLLGQLAATLRRRRWQIALRRLSAARLSSTGNPRPILWLFRPGLWPLLEHLDPLLVVYHVVDEYSAYPGLTAEQAARQRALDRQLAARADLIFCTARSLADARRPLNANTHYLPNAVNYRAFQRALADPQRPAPPALTDLPHPLLGVIGGIGAKLDLLLLAELAERRPGWSLALVGPQSQGLAAGRWARLRALPNVHLIGPVPPARVPAAIAACDVCLIPYRLTEQTGHVNPLKVYEYLAVGQPVVATPLPELQQLRAFVRLAADPTAFIAAVETALAQAADPVARASRRAIAAANTWEHRGEQMETRLQAALAKRQ